MEQSFFLTRDVKPADEVTDRCVLNYGVNVTYSFPDLILEGGRSAIDAAAQFLRSKGYIR